MGVRLAEGEDEDEDVENGVRVDWFWTREDEEALQDGIDDDDKTIFAKSHTSAKSLYSYRREIVFIVPRRVPISWNLDLALLARSQPSFVARLFKKQN